MSIVSVDNIQPIGSGTSVTVNSAATLVVGNINSSGVVTATTFKGSFEATSASFSSNIDANGDLDVDGHTFLDNVSVGGATTCNGNVKISRAAGTDAILNINEGTTTNPLRLMQTATEAKIQCVASQPFNIRSQSGSGSTGYLAFWTRDSERIRITSDGNVGINTTAPQNGAHVQHFQSTVRHQSFQSSDGDLAIVSDNNSNPVVYVKGTGTADLVNVFDNATEVFTIRDGGKVGINETDPNEMLHVEGKIEADNLHVGGSSYTHGSGNTFTTDAAIKCHILNQHNGSLSSKAGNAANRKHFRFENPNGEVGSISTNGSNIVIAGESDYRLKENVVTLSNAITRLKTLKPYRFNFKSDPNTTLDGFLAHELTTVPLAIVGEKDAVVTQEMIDSGDFEPEKLNDPIYQQIDQSKLVPLLTAALQEAVAKIEVLEAEVTALKGS